MTTTTVEQAFEPGNLVSFPRRVANGDYVTEQGVIQQINGDYAVIYRLGDHGVFLKHVKRLTLA